MTTALQTCYKGSSIKDVRSEEGGLAQMWTNADKGGGRWGGVLIACGRLQLSFALGLAMLACAAAWRFLSPLQWWPLAILNGPLRLLDVCCVWLLGLWHGVSLKPSIHWPTHCLNAAVCMQLLQPSLWVCSSSLATNLSRTMSQLKQRRPSPATLLLRCLMLTTDCLYAFVWLAAVSCCLNWLVIRPTTEHSEVLN